MKALRAVKKSESPMAATGSRARASAQTTIRQPAVSNQAMQRLLSFGPAPQIQRQPDSPVPSYRDCTESITGISDANEKLEEARIRARKFVQAAIKALDKIPEPGTELEKALKHHFISPTADQRTTIRETYQQILPKLSVNNMICNTEYICDDNVGLWDPGDKLIHVCPRFWKLNPNCRAITLIHEAAHDAGISISGPHPFVRGSASYPRGKAEPPADITTADRMNNPDAFGFFAAHVYRSTDTGSDCRGK